MIYGLGDLNQYKGEPAEATEFVSRVNVIVGVIRNIGVILSVIILIIIGIKYMLGSVEEKADYKKSLLPYVIGAFLVFSISLLPQLIYNFVQNF